MPEATDPTTPAPAAAPAVQPVVVVTPPGNQDPVLGDSKALQERLDRERRKALKEAGFESVEQAAEFRKSFEAMQQAEKERAQAQLSEVERAKVQQTEAEARARAAEEALKAEREERKIEQALHAAGVKDLDYGRFLVDAAKKRGESDIDKVLSDAKGDPTKRVALGIEAPQTVPASSQTTVTLPAGTSPATPGGAPKPPTAGGAAPTEKTADMMSSDEWQAWKRSQGVF